MSPSTRAWIGAFFVAVLVVVLVVSEFGCGGAASAPPPPPINVAISNSTATVEAGSAAQFAATVTNDSSAKGVTWKVSCSAAACGGVSPASTPSGTPTTYTAPPAAPTSDLIVTLTATSVANAARSVSATITVPAITVSVSPSSGNVLVGHTLTFSATVSNDPSNGNVTWTLSGAQCPANCGTVAPSSTASGAPTTYTASANSPSTNVTITATSMTDPTKSGSATISVTGIIVSVAPASASVPSGGTQQFTATVSNDSSNGGVSWTLLEGRRFCSLFPFQRCGPISYSACAPTCGTVSTADTASGVPTNYTAPAHFVPPRCFFRQPCFAGVFIQATSVTNSAAFGRASITILPISVSVSPPSASVAVNKTQQFTATVTNDGTNSGVTWSLTVNGVSCSVDCGTLSSNSSGSGSSITYRAPANVPAFPVVTITATSVEDTTKSGSATITITTPSGAACGAGSGNESLLKGQYAFLLNGFDSISQVTMAGSFTADGAGKVTAGEEDFNSASSVQTDVTLDPTASFYAVGPDHRGCLGIAISGGATTYFRFALGSINASNIAASGHIIRFDDTAGSGTRVAGTMRLQDASSFSASQFKGNYVLGLLGAGSGRVALAGTFTSDGASAISSGKVDLNNAGTVTSNLSFSAGSFTCCSVNGRGTLTLPVTTPNLSLPGLAFYMLTSSDALVVDSGGEQLTGEAFGVPSATVFSQVSLQGSSVLRQTAQSTSGPVVDVSSLAADGNGNVTFNDNINNAGTFSTSSTALTYVVDSGGRVTLSGTATPPVLYLSGNNQGFLVGTDADVSFGILEPQTGGPFSDASLSGGYMLGTENPSAGTVSLQSGVLTPDGAGTATGTSDTSDPSGLTQNQSLNLNYSVLANGTGSLGSNTTAILISGNKLVFISNTSANPTITVVEK